MQYSTNYNMNKPELNEQYRLSHWNDNTDIIDTELKRNADDISSEATRATNAETALQNITNATFKTALLNFCYPIGSLYWSSKSTDPAQLFGGTWTQIKDRFIWAKGDSDTVNATGGAKTVTLTVNNLPSHTHSFTPSGTVSSHTHSFTPSGTVSSHSHGLNNHTHSFTPSGTVSSHTHGLNNHTHSFSWSGSHRHKVWGTNRNDSVTCVFLGDVNACGIGSSRTKYNVEEYFDNTALGTSPIIEDTTITVSGTTGGNSGNTTSVQPTFTGTAGTTGGNSGNTTSVQPTFTGTAGTTGSSTPTFTGSAGTTGDAGGGTAHNNMPPYIVKYCWERTA